MQLGTTPKKCIFGNKLATLYFMTSFTVLLGERLYLWNAPHCFALPPVPGGVVETAPSGAAELSTYKA